MWENLNQLLYILEALMLLNGCDICLMVYGSSLLAIRYLVKPKTETRFHLSYSLSAQTNKSLNCSSFL